MKGLDSLIRIAKWRVDEARRNLAELDRLADGLRNRLYALGEEVARERAIASSDPESARAFAGYREAATARRERLDESLADLELRHAEMQDQLNEAFGELKRYEIAARDRARREAFEARRAEQARLDEIGLRDHQAASG